MVNHLMHFWENIDSVDISVWNLPCFQPSATLGTCFCIFQPESQAGRHFCQICLPTNSSSRACSVESSVFILADAAASHRQHDLQQLLLPGRSTPHPGGHDLHLVRPDGNGKRLQRRLRQRAHDREEREKRVDRRCQLRVERLPGRLSFRLLQNVLLPGMDEGCHRPSSLTF